MTGPFSTDALEKALADLAGTSRPGLVCAVSGGCDSLAMAHAAAAIDWPARAVYVDHGLHEDSAAWGQQVVERLDRFGMSARCVRVDIPHGPNLEARARDARYAALSAELADGEVLLTAHHMDDQALTMMLQLLRGAGVAGLAAMPARSALGRGEHWRPLLETSSSALAEYCANAGLAPIVDPSNDDRRFDRNYLRHEIVPVLEQRWPSWARTLSRSAAHCAEAQALLEEQGQAACHGDAVWLGAPQSEGAAANALRTLLRRRAIAAPPAVRLTEFVRQVRDAAADTKPSLVVGDLALRRFGRWVYAVEEPLSTTPFELALVAGRPTRLPGAAGVLVWQPDEPTTGSLRVASRKGGERFGSDPSRRLKSFLNEQRVLPWRREAVPLVYDGLQLVAVADWWRSPDMNGQLRWRPEADFRAPPSPT